MNESKWDRWSLWSGTIFALLFVASGTMVATFDYLPQGEEVVAAFSANSGTITLGAYLGTVAAFFLFWFAGSMRGMLRSSDRSSGYFADIAFGGAVAAGALLAGANSLVAGAAQRAAATAGISPDAAMVLTDIWGQFLGLAISVALAAFCAGIGLALLRTRLLPAWFGWLSVIIAVGLLTPAGYMVLTLVLIWTVVLNIWLFLRAGQSAPAAAVAADAGEQAL